MGYHVRTSPRNAVLRSALAGVCVAFVCVGALISTSLRKPDPCYAGSLADMQTRANYTWHVPAVGATVRALALGRRTLGFAVDLEGPLSLEAAERYLGRYALAKQLLWSGPVVYPPMAAEPVCGSTPNYTSSLVCSNGSRRGTAIVVLQNYHCDNIWHALANQHGLWLLLKLSGTDPSDVHAVLPMQYSRVNRPARLLSDLAWPLFRQTSDNFDRRDCFARVVWMEAYRDKPGPFWERLAVTNPLATACRFPQAPIFKDFIAFQQAYLDNADVPQSPVARVHRHPRFCYMSRRLVAPRRYFEPVLAAHFEAVLDTWAAMNADRAEFDRMEFDASVPMAEQIQRVAACSVLFGSHGAGLAHQFWIDELRTNRRHPLHVIEIDPGGEHGAERCAHFYENMAAWFGHRYTCFNRLPGHGISKIGHSLIVTMNVPLFVRVLDRTLAELEAAPTNYDKHAAAFAVQ